MGLYNFTFRSIFISLTNLGLFVTLISIYHQDILLFLAFIFCLLNYFHNFCRTILGFWAGHRNSKIRVILAREWENDTELAISNNRISRATGELVYQKQFYRTKFCICPGGSQVNSARIADSIHYGCIPGEYLDFLDPLLRYFPFIP